ncbi:MAG: glycoside hydrolase family 1 protein [Bacteriovoracia bacterium]
MKFLWGAATSAHQIEGYNSRNDWWEWEQLGKIEGGVLSGKATDHFHRFREDIRLAAELKLNSYRFSIEWSRIEPERGKWDPSAIAWYLDLITECERHGILPMATLHHFTSPAWFTAQGGFAQRAAPDLFLNFVKKVVEVMGHRVFHWCTFNEPMVLVIGSYLAGFMPPAEFDPRRANHAIHNLLRAHVLAYDWIHQEAAERGSPVEVGLAHNFIDFRPDRVWHPLEWALTWSLSKFYNWSWIEAVLGRSQNFEVAGVLPNIRPVKEAQGRRSVDFLGVNYYTKGYLRWQPKTKEAGNTAQLPFGISFARRQEAMSDVGWAIHPRGFRRVLKGAARYGLPIYVTENGIADRDDAHRAEFIRQHLLEIARAIEKGADIRGYYYWSLLDNFEWIKGFGPRFGLYHVDYETFERRAHPSADYYRAVIAAHGSQQAPQAEHLRMTRIVGKK